MARRKISQRKVLLLFSMLGLLLVVFLAACSGASTAGTTNTSSRSVPDTNQFSNSKTNDAGGSAQDPAAPATNTDTSKDTGPSYLIKTLKVTMQATDTRQAASVIAAWISAADPRSTSAGATYTQVNNDAYNVEIIYDVQSILYPKIYNYLRDYSSQKGANSKLVGFNEAVQDVTNDYTDTQSRLKNYKGEQERLLSLLSHADTVADILSIEQKLTDVEGSIESSEAHLSLLASQVTYYTITVDLQPLTTAPHPQVQTSPGWSIGQVFAGAFGASLDFGRGLLTFLIWIVAFALYLIPLLIVVLLVRKYGHHISPWFAPVKTDQTPPKVE